MMENRPPLTSPDGSSNRNPPERCPRPLYSRDSTQEHQEIPQEDQNEYVIKVEVKEEAEVLYVRGDDPCKEEEDLPEISTDTGDTRDTQRDVKAEEEEEGHVQIKEEKIPIDISTDGPSNSNSPERCPSSLYYEDSTQEDHKILQDNEDEKVIKVEVKMEDEEETDGDDELCKEDEIPSEIRTDGRYRRYSTERPLAISPDGEIEDYDVSSESSEEDLVTSTLHSGLHRADLSFDPSAQGKNCPSPSPPLSNHKSADGDGTFSCTECEKNFIVRAKLIKHQRTHSAEKPFLCSECGKSFRQKCLLRRHQTRHNSDKPFSCSECGKSFVQKSDIVRHQRTHTGEKPFSCSECGKSFARKHYLNTHEKVHSGEKPYSCSECSKCFSRKSYLNTHEKVHTGEKPFSCSECGKCFADRYRLVTHHRVHTGDRPYTCTECGRSFAQSSDLIRHRKVHTGERPYSCSECGRGFINKSDLIIHERIHTGDQPYSCSECGKRFSHKSTLKSHLGTHR